MLKWYGLLLAGSLVAVVAPVNGAEPLVTLAVAQNQGSGTLLGVVPDAPAAVPQPTSAADDQLSLAPRPSVAFSSPLKMLGDPTHYGAPIDPYLFDQRSIAPTYLTDIIQLMRQAFTGGVDDLDALGNVFDVADSERPWSKTTSIRLQAKTDEGYNRWVPFATVAHEVAAVEDRERLGIGGGMAYHITADTAFVTELLYFGDRMNSGNAWDRETRFTVGFQFTF